MKKFIYLIFLSTLSLSTLYATPPKLVSWADCGVEWLDGKKLFVGSRALSRLYTRSGVERLFFDVTAGSTLKKGKGSIIFMQDGREAVPPLSIDSIYKYADRHLFIDGEIPLPGDDFGYYPSTPEYNVYKYARYFDNRPGSVLQIILEPGLVIDSVSGDAYKGDTLKIVLMDRKNKDTDNSDANDINRSSGVAVLYKTYSQPVMASRNVSLYDPVVFKFSYPVVINTMAWSPYIDIYENSSPALRDLGKSKPTQRIRVSSDSVRLFGDSLAIIHAPFSKNARVEIFFDDLFRTPDSMVYVPGSSYWGIGAVVKPCVFRSPYYFVSTGGSGSREDAAYNFFFTTGTDTPPVVSTYSPADNSKDIAYTAPVSITFNEPIKKGVGNIVIKENGVVKQTIAVTDAGVTLVGTTLTIPHTPFSNKAEVSIQLDKGIVKDLAGSPYAGIKDDMTWNFSIVDVTITDLTVTAFSPVDNATNVSANPIVTMTFNRDVEKGAGNITIKENALVKKVIDVMDPSVMISGKVVTVDHGLTFKASANVSITVDAGTFKDMAGKTYAGFTDPSKWNFKINSIGTPIAADPVKGEESLLSTTGIEIFPVPSSDKITINLTDPNMEVSHVKVTDLSGKVVYEKSVSIKATDAKAIEVEAKNYKGIYILQVSTNQGTKTKRVVLE